MSRLPPGSPRDPHHGGAAGGTPAVHAPAFLLPRSRARARVAPPRLARPLLVWLLRPNGLPGVRRVRRRARGDWSRRGVALGVAGGSTGDRRAAPTRNHKRPHGHAAPTRGVACGTRGAGAAIGFPRRARPRVGATSS